MNITSAKISFLNARSKIVRLVHPQMKHLSGYTAGNSPNTDILPVVNMNGCFREFRLRFICEEKGLLHPTVHLLLYNSKGKMLVQKRSMNKDSSPGKLSQSVGGHISKEGVSPSMRLIPKNTLKKETLEELGIQMHQFKFLTSYYYESKKGKNRELVYLFEGKYDGRIRPNRSEVEWAGFFDLSAVNKLSLTKPELFSNSFLQDIYYLRRIS